MNATERTRRRYRILLASNVVLFIAYGLFVVIRNRPFASWLILAVIFANAIVYRELLKARAG